MEELNNEEEQTKEVSLEDLTNSEKEAEEELTVDEEQEENIEEEQTEEKESKKVKDDKTKTEPTKKLKKKTLYIIIGVVAALIILITVLVVVLLPKDKEEGTKTTDKKDKTTGSAYVQAIKKSLESGDLAKEISKALNDSSVDTNKINLISMDIDSDDKQELVAYVEDSSKKYILQFEVGDEVTYEDSFQVDTKDSLGYTYSTKDDETYWYTVSSSNYTIIKKQKKVIKEEDYMNEYFTIINTYKNVPILNNAIEYDLVTPFDVEKLEKDEITKEKLLEDNKIKESEIKPAAEKHFREKQEEEEQKKKEEEEKKKAEEEAAKKEAESSFKLEGKTLHYGKYSTDPAIIIGYVIINSNGSGEIDGNSCTWQFGKHDFAQDSSGAKEMDSVNFTCTDGTYSFTAFEDDKLGNGGEIDLTLEK